MSSRLVLIGHSHALALHEAHASMPKRRGPPAYSLAGFAPYPRAEGSDTFWREFALTVDGSHVVLSWDGNEHNGAFLFEPTPPFFVHHPRVPTPDVIRG